MQAWWNKASSLVAGRHHLTLSVSDYEAYLVIFDCRTWRYSNSRCTVASKHIGKLFCRWCGRAIEGFEERLARWILTCHDRRQSDHMPLTHEFLGQMLGAPRTTVTLAAGMLQSPLNELLLSM